MDQQTSLEFRNTLNRIDTNVLYSEQIPNVDAKLYVRKPNPLVPLMRHAALLYAAKWLGELTGSDAARLRAIIDHLETANDRHIERWAILNNSLFSFTNRIIEERVIARQSKK